MLEEEGVVVTVEGELAMVKTKRSSMCDGCRSGGFCKALGGGSDIEVAARNEVGAKIGDEVKVTVASETFLKASFLVYMVPVTALILGAVLGTKVGPALSSEADSDLFPVICGLVFFSLSFVLMKLWAKGIKGGDWYCPVVSELLYGKAYLCQ